MMFTHYRSKYRFVFANDCKQEQVWRGVQTTKSAWDSNWLAVSGKWIAVVQQAEGRVGIIDAAKPGPVTNPLPSVCHGRGAVLNLEFSPFSDDCFGTCGEDCLTKLWRIPVNGLPPGTVLNEPIQTLAGHKRKVGILKFHPTVEDILATASTDYTVRIWDLESGVDKLSIPEHNGIIQSIDWNYNGSLLVSYCKDKLLRILDPRQQSVAAQADSHTGIKGGRALWCGKHDYVLSVGFSKAAAREVCLRDARKIEVPLVVEAIDTAAGILMPFYEEDSDLLFLAGKGDGAISYYELQLNGDPQNFFHTLSSYKTNEPTRGCAALSRRHYDVFNNEIMRLYRLSNPDKLTPISFIVPRKSDNFQEDLYPPCRSSEPDQKSSVRSWFDGENFLPTLIDLGEYPRPPPKLDKVIRKVVLFILGQYDSASFIATVLVPDVVLLISLRYCFLQGCLREF